MKNPKWMLDAMELLDRFERRHNSVIHIRFTLENLANEIGVTRQTLDKNKPFHQRYIEVRDQLKRLGDSPLTEKRKQRLTEEQRIRKLERELAEMRAELNNAQLRWMAVLRLAERERWDGFEFKLRELVNPQDLRFAPDVIRKPEE